MHWFQKPGGNKKLPVLVWIHGGAWWGGKVDFDVVGVDHLLDEDVMVVGLHYRLGPFGFMTTGDRVLPGNNGLKDQILALKWIHENIEHFGGDPNEITLVGQSAGSASIGYILQYPGARGNCLSTHGSSNLTRHLQFIEVIIYTNDRGRISKWQ